jgi:transposase
MTVIKLSDNQWEIIRKEVPQKPLSHLGGRPPIVDDRKCFEGILWILSNGLPWSELPGQYGSRSSVNRRFLAWTSSGAWFRMCNAFLYQLSRDEQIFWASILEKSHFPRTRKKFPHRINKTALIKVKNREYTNQG